MKSLAICFVLSGLACTAVAPKPPAPIVNPFDAAAVAFAADSTGTGIVEGQAFLKTRGGEVRYGAGNDVFLIPYSGYSFEWYSRLTAGGPYAEAPPMDPGLAAVTRKTISGGDGRFRFENVPPGSYLILTTVTWEVGYSKQGGYIGAPIDVKNGKTVNTIITR